MKSYPLIIDHHGLKFHRTKEMTPEFDFILTYALDMQFNFPPIKAKVKAIEDTNGQVDGTVEQIHAHIGNFLATYFLLNETKDNQSKEDTND